MLKQWILYSACSDWLLKVGISIAIHWFTLQLLRASDAKLAKKVTKFCLKALTGKTLSVLLEFIDGTSGKDFCILYFTCSKMSLKLNLTVFKWMVLNTKRIHNSFWRKFPTIAKKMPFSFIGPQENVTAFRSFARQNCNCWQQLLSWKPWFLCSIISLF